MAASWHLHYFLRLLFLTFSISPFKCSHRKCSIKKTVLKVLHIHRKTAMLELFFNKLKGWRVSILLESDSNTSHFLWIFLFTNSYGITCFSFCIDAFNKKDYKKKCKTQKRARASSQIKGRVSGEFWWWTRSEISKNQRLSCSPSASTRTACPFALKLFYRVSQNTAVQKDARVFVIISSSLFLKE